MSRMSLRRPAYNLHDAHCTDRFLFSVQSIYLSICISIYPVHRARLTFPSWAAVYPAPYILIEIA